MRWSNEMFYILLLNSFAGAIAYGFWMIAKSGMAKRNLHAFVIPPATAYQCSTSARQLKK